MKATNKIGIIIGREYSTRVRKKSFLVMTFLVPLLMLLMMVLPTVLMLFSGNKSLNVAIIDKTGLYASSITDNKDFTFTPADRSLEEYQKLGKDNSLVDAIISIEGPLLVGDSLELDASQLTIFTYKQQPDALEEYVEGILSERLTEERLNAYDIPGIKEMVSKAEVKFNATMKKWTGTEGEAQSTSGTISYIIGFGLTMVNYMFIMMYGGMVLNGVLEEKKSRIMEVMVSSVRPFDMMMGKIFGIGLVGLTQIALWILLSSIIIGAASLTFLGGLYDASTVATMQQAQMGGLMGGGAIDAESFAELQNIMGYIAGINFTEIIVLAILYFIGGYLLYAALFAAIGSAVSSEEDTNQFMMPVTILMLFSFFAAIGSMKNPDGALAFWGSIIPFTSSVVMMVRLPYEVPIWQEALSITLLFAAFVLITWFAAKIYRVGVLMYGKKPSLKELWRWTTYK